MSETIETGYKKLIVYQKSRGLITETHKITDKFPSKETYGLTSQMRRACISVGANIVEGYSKSSTREFIRFLDISIGSINELEFMFEISVDLKYLSENEIEPILSKIIEVKKLLYSFQKSLKKKVSST